MRDSAGIFSKFVVSYSLLMCTIITLRVLWHATLDAGTVAVLAGMWSSELLMLCAKRILAKQRKNKSSEDTPI